MFDIIIEHNLVEILAFTKPSLIVTGMWQGEYEMQFFLNYSLNFQIVKSIILKQKNLAGYSPDYADEVSISHNYRKFKNWLKNGSNRIVKREKAHFFMFRAWKKSMSIRYVIDAFFIFIVSYILQSQMSDFQDGVVEYFNINPTYEALGLQLQDTSLTVAERQQVQAEFEEYQNKFLEITDKAYNKIIIIYSLFGILTAYALRNLCQIAYAKLRRRKWQSIYFETFLSTVQSVLAVISIHRFLSDYQYRTSSDSRYNKAVKIQPMFDESFLDITLVLGLYTAMQWTRILLIFRVNSFVGPLLNIIQNMLREILRFFIIYLLIVLVFASAGRLLFVTLPEFKSDIEAWKTLFSASLGSFDFTVFDNQRMVLSHDYGYYFLMIYLIITNIVILNFMIAILGNTYSRLKKISNALYLIEIVKVRNIFEYDKYYSSMISLFIPLNVVLLPFYPILAV